MAVSLPTSKLWLAPTGPRRAVPRQPSSNRPPYFGREYRRTSGKHLCPAPHGLRSTRLLVTIQVLPLRPVPRRLQLCCSRRTEPPIPSSTRRSGRVTPASRSGIPTASTSTGCGWAQQETVSGPDWSAETNAAPAVASATIVFDGYGAPAAILAWKNASDNTILYLDPATLPGLTGAIRFRHG